MSNEQILKELRRLFAKYDSDKSGEIDFEEFVKIRSEITGRDEDTARKTDQLLADAKDFDQVDWDGSGTIDFSEFMEWQLKRFGKSPEDLQTSLKGSLANQLRAQGSKESIREKEEPMGKQSSLRESWLERGKQLNQSLSRENDVEFGKQASARLGSPDGTGSGTGSANVRPLSPRPPATIPPSLNPETAEPPVAGKLASSFGKQRSVGPGGNSTNAGAQLLLPIAQAQSADNKLAPVKRWTTPSDRLDRPKDILLKPPGADATQGAKSPRAASPRPAMTRAASPRPPPSSRLSVADRPKSPRPHLQGVLRDGSGPNQIEPPLSHSRRQSKERGVVPKRSTSKDEQSSTANDAMDDIARFDQRRRLLPGQFMSQASVDSER